MGKTFLQCAPLVLLFLHTVSCPSMHRRDQLQLLENFPLVSGGCCWVLPKLPLLQAEETQLSQFLLRNVSVPVTLLSSTELSAV